MDFVTSWTHVCLKFLYNTVRKEHTILKNLSLVCLWPKKWVVSVIEEEEEIQSFRFILFYVDGSFHRESMSIIVQQDATLYSFYSLQTAVHVSGDNFTYHQERE
jgi:hypothetical protein